MALALAKADPGTHGVLFPSCPSPHHANPYWMPHGTASTTCRGHCLWSPLSRAGPSGGTPDPRQPTPGESRAAVPAAGQCVGYVQEKNVVPAARQSMKRSWGYSGDYLGITEKFSAWRLPHTRQLV